MDLVKNYALKSAYDLIYIKVENQVGLPMARNIGIKYSNHKFIGFLDDDCFPVRKDLIYRAYKWLDLKNQNIVAVGGPVYKNSYKPNFIKSRIKSNSTFFKIKNVFRLILEIIDTLCYKREKLTFVKSLVGCSFFFKKSFVMKCGGFDPNFDDNFIREDTDICMKMEKFGLLLSDPKMPVNHKNVKYGGCRVNPCEYYTNVLSNTILLTLKHKKIIVTVLINSFVIFLLFFKTFIKGIDNNQQKIKRIFLLKSVLKGLPLGFIKYYSSKKESLYQKLILKSKKVKILSWKSI